MAKVCGKLISTKFVLGKVTQLKTRHLYKLIENSVSWDSRISLQNHTEAIQELFFFWKEQFKTFNYKNLFNYYIPELIVFSDASDTGLAAHLTNNEKLKISFRNFTVNEKRNSSTWRELMAIEISLKALLNYLKSKHVLWKTDNYAASCIVKRYLVSRSFFSFCTRKL